VRPGVRKPLALAGALVIGLLIVGGVIAAVGKRDRASASSEGSFRGSEPPVRIKLPRFRLASYRGGEVTDASLRRKVIVFTLLDSQCTESCPIIASVVARTVDRLSPSERAQVRAIAVSTDPAEDTPTSVRRFLKSRRAEGRLDYLVGDEAKLRRLWRELHVLSSLDSGNDSLHSAPVRLYNGNLVWVSTLHAGVDLTEENLLHDIRVALAAEGGDR
jgi:cytochrome oxidase Cu insertion factor (SCO1/SenC/PrrC family)